jgi:hypothetical protein
VIPVTIWLIPVNNDDKGGVYNETQEEIIEWIAFASSMFGILMPVTPSPLLNYIKVVAVAQGRVFSTMMIAEDYLDGEYDFSVMLDKMSGVAEDAINDSAENYTPDLFSIVEGPDMFNGRGTGANSTTDTLCDSFSIKSNTYCNLKKGHRGAHEY